MSNANIISQLITTCLFFENLRLQLSDLTQSSRKEWPSWTGAVHNYLYLAYCDLIPLSRLHGAKWPVSYYNIHSAQYLSSLFLACPQPLLALRDAKLWTARKLADFKNIKTSYTNLIFTDERNTKLRMIVQGLYHWTEQCLSIRWVWNVQRYVQWNSFIYRWSTAGICAAPFSRVFVTTPRGRTIN